MSDIRWSHLLGSHLLGELGPLINDSLGEAALSIGGPLHSTLWALLKLPCKYA